MASRKSQGIQHQTLKTRRALLECNLDDLHHYRVNRHTFTVYVGGDPNIQAYADDDSNLEPGVEYHMADRFDINLNLLTDIDSSRPILVKVASCGGNWTEGMQMFGAIATCPNPVTVMATKWARSMTSIIPLAADRFVMRPPARYMFHHGTTGYEGLAGEEFSTFVEEQQLSRKCMIDIYVARLRSQGAFKQDSPEKIREMLNDKMRRKSDVWLDAVEAVRWGFADGIFTGDLKTLRATKVNTARRRKMLEVIG